MVLVPDAHLIGCQSCAGHCSYADRAGLQFIDATRRLCSPDLPSSARDKYPAWFQDVMSCMSDQPLRHINGSWRENVVHVGTAWVGLGARCRTFRGHCHDPSQRNKLPPTPDLLASWRDTLGECMGYSTHRQAPLHPLKLLFVDR